MGLRRRRRAPPVFIFLLVLFVVAVVTELLELALRPDMIVLARTQAEWTATRVIQEAIINQMDPNLRYEDLVFLQRDTGQRVVYAGANTVAINRMTASVALAIQKQFALMENESISIPLGQVLGVDLLAARGPRINWRLLPVGTAKVQVLDGFEQAGINQTRHYLTLRVESRVRVIFGQKHEEISVTCDMPLVDAIIVGEVPKTMVQTPLSAIPIVPQQ